MSYLPSLQLARAVFKSTPALATIVNDSTLLPPPSAALDCTHLSIAREVFYKSIDFDSTDNLPPRVLFPSFSRLVKAATNGVDELCEYISDSIKALLESCGDMGKRVLEMTDKYPTVTAALASGVVIAIFVGIAYKFYVVRSTADGEAKVEEVPFLSCPITLAPFIDPVVASDGHTYERNAIEAWFNAGYRTSPVTGEQLEHTNLLTNWVIRQAQVQRMEGLRF